MKYKIIYGSLLYESGITTEKIFNELIACAEAQGMAFNTHWSEGGKTYAKFKQNKHLNFDPKGKKYTYGKAYVIDNNPQGMKKLTIEDLIDPKAVNEVIINSYPIY